MTVPEHAIHYLEIVTPDVEAARRMHESTFGWRFGAPAPELGNAVVATLPNGSLCGIRAPMHEQEKPILRAYIRVADLTAAVTRAERMGAAVLLDRMELPGRGVIAICMHGGVEQGFWQLP